MDPNNLAEVISVIVEPLLNAQTVTGFGSNGKPMCLMDVIARVGRQTFSPSPGRLLGPKTSAARHKYAYIHHGQDTSGGGGPECNLQLLGDDSSRSERGVNPRNHRGRTGQPSRVGAHLTYAHQGPTGSLGAAGQVVRRCVLRHARLRFRGQRCAGSLWIAG